MWYVKMYFSEKRELFQCDASGIQGVPSVDREFPFLESLLTFLEMDCGELTPILQRIADRWGRLITEFDRDAGTEAMVELGQLKSRHIYLELLYVRWYDRFSRMGIYGDPQQQAAKNYLHDSPRDPSLFRFRPIPLSFEPVEPGRCSPVLYSASIPDMIDYSLRSCVERGITVRRCKNCGRYFPQTGRVSAEYCERPVPRGQQTCREAGAFQQWIKKQSDDPVFKAYRKEYKKRFAWIKAGRISDTDFYAWSEQAREMKKKCDRDVITLEEYVEWLKNS